MRFAGVAEQRLAEDLSGHTLKYNTHVSIQSMGDSFFKADTNIRMQADVKYINPQYQFNQPLLKQA